MLLSHPAPGEQLSATVETLFLVPMEVAVAEQTHSERSHWFVSELG